MLETDFDKGARLQASRLHSFLKGIRVVDLSRYLPGPLASLMLSDLGAAVIKVESPQGDGLETLGPLRADGRSQLLRMEFPLVGASSDDPRAQALEARSRVYLRLTLSPVGKKTPLVWPGLFPVRAPEWTTR